MEVISRPDPASAIRPALSRSPGARCRLWVETPDGPASPREAWPVETIPSWAAAAVFSSQVVMTPSSTMLRCWTATPSSSNGVEPRPRRRKGSSIMLTPAGRTRWPSLSFRKELPRAMAGPEMAPSSGDRTWVAMRFSKMTGAVVEAILRGPVRATARSPAFRPISAAPGRSDR
ncbi:hypothetical protein D3C80_1238890 [compost metagenome]